MLRTLAALMMLLVGSASAATVLEDVSGDVHTDIPAPITASIGRDYADLVKLDVEELDQAISFSLTFAGAEPTNVHSYADASVGLRHESTDFQVLLHGHDVALGLAGQVLNQKPFAELQRKAVGQDQWLDAGRFPVEQALASPVWKFEIPRANLTDEDGVAPFPGRALTDFWVRAVDIQCAVVPCLASGFSDAMPDQGVGEIALPIEKGALPSGIIRLSSARPIRASNGEEGTFVYEVAIRNDGAATEAVLLESTQLPNAWQVTLPIDAVELKPGDTTRVPVIVAIPFRHQHGATETFNVVAKPSSQPSRTSMIQLGVKYLEIPQPAGHHNHVYIHAGASAERRYPVTGLGAGFASQPFMSTDAEDSRSTGSPVGPDIVDAPFLPSRYQWCVPLEPGLSLGLDFKDEAGSFEGQLGFGTTATGTLTGQLILVGSTPDLTEETLCSDKLSKRLAELASASVSISLDESLPFKLDLTPVTDVVPDVTGQNMVLELTFTFNAAEPRYTADQPFLEPGAFLTLPLAEYHDAQPLSLGPQVLKILGEPRVNRAPGTTAVFDVEVQGSATDYEFDVLGTRTDWVQLYPDSNIVHVAIQIPSDEPSGSIADLILRAQKGSDVSLARVTVEVDTAATADDTARLTDFQQTKDAPMALWLVIAALAFALAKRR